jgi:GWxTD domain-containing protein
MVIAAGIGLAACLPVEGQVWDQTDTFPACSPTSPRFCVDGAVFLDDGAQVLETYVEICNEGLQFLRLDEGYRASADVVVVLRDDDGSQVTGDTYRISLWSSTYEGTNSPDSCKTRAMRFRAEPGDFKMEVTVFDGDSRSKSVLNGSISLGGFETRPALSDIVFLSKAGGSESERWPGFRPNVGRVYSVVSEDITFCYEIYRGENDTDSATVVYRVDDENGNHVFREAKHYSGEQRVVCIERLAVDSLSNGRYTLTATLVGRDDRPLVQRSRAFQVRSDELYLTRNLEEAEALLAYIASGSLIDAFRKADVQERKRIWDDFWREKDPTPRTPRNEFYEEHVRRFRYANAHFPSSLSEGWQTDRGRIYILYGEPDERESYSMEVDRNPMEIWYYFDLGKRFVFVDETGFGDFVLVSG